MYKRQGRAPVQKIQCVVKHTFKLACNYLKAYLCTRNKQEGIMEWRNVHLRFQDLKNNDIVVCKLEDRSNWNKTGLVLAVYQNGYLYDTWSREDDTLPCDEWELTDIVCEYSVTGKNIGTNQNLN